MTELQTKDTANELESLKAALAAILNRISSLEAAMQPPAHAAPADVPAAVAAAPAPAAAAPVAVESEEISEEVMLAISAAVAAFLGERAHVRTVRLARTGAWAQQGRVFIQASHHISVQHHQYQYR
jgi:methylmalonyl-CoA carboxyltransferase large subunit